MILALAILSDAHMAILVLLACAISFALGGIYGVGAEKKAVADILALGDHFKYEAKSILSDVKTHLHL